MTAAEVQQINERIVVLRAKLRLNGATALTPTPEWSTLRKEIAALNKKLIAVSKQQAKAAAEPVEEQTADSPEVA